MRLGSSKKHRNYSLNGGTVLHTKGRGNSWPCWVLPTYYYPSAASIAEEPLSKRKVLQLVCRDGQMHRLCSCF